jgi:hypothetical protein
MSRVANFVMGIAAGTLACGGFSNGPLIVDEYRGTIVAARKELTTHGAALRDLGVDCSTAMSSYGNAMEPVVLRMESLSRSMDRCAGALGLDDRLSYLETCQSMRTEVAAHVEAGCARPLGEEIARHAAVLEQLLESEERAADGMQRSMDASTPECAHD